MIYERGQTSLTQCQRERAMSRLVTLMIAAYVLPAAVPACAVWTLYLGTRRPARVRA